MEEGVDTISGYCALDILLCTTTRWIQNANPFSVQLFAAGFLPSIFKTG
jgi:hypothetical protein